MGKASRKKAITRQATNRQAENPALPQQDMADALYASLYEKISLAKEQADVAGKPFAMPIGEGHRDRNSLLIELMAVDICDRLGIKNILFELDEQGVTVDTALARNWTKEAVDYNRSAAKLDLPRGGNAIAAIAAMCVQEDHNGQVMWTRKESGNHFIVLAAALAKNMNVLPGDPNHAKRALTKNELATDLAQVTRENGDMAMAINSAAKGGCISIGGRLHLPDIKEFLEAMKVNILPLKTKDGWAFDTSLIGTLEYASKVSAHWQDRCNRLKEIETFRVPDGQTIKTADAIRLALEASLAHEIAAGDTQARARRDSLRRCMSEGRGRH